MTIEKWPAKKVRETFIKYFTDRQHTYIPSSSTIPHNDPTLLFANAGMNQFKPIFLGTVDPSSEFGKLKRAVNSQKCIRAGGKHNDLEDVGRDSYHHSMFEMLGNWSFGDYFKKEAVSFSWDLLTNVYGIDRDRLYATYFAGDQRAGLEPDLETKALWEEVGCLKEHILPGNMKDNFWEMGEVGPCGPCSELHYDRLGARNASNLVNQDDPNVLEIWNNVFIQYNRETDGTLRSLPAKHVDTGMGFERLVSVLQNKFSNYDTDVFTPLFSRIQELTGARPYSGKEGIDDIDGLDTAYRVVADHVRALTFAICDGGVPDKDGRGYVLRRILRRGARYLNTKFNVEIGNFFSRLAPALIEQVKYIFPEVDMQYEDLKKILDDEEKSFSSTLKRGEEIFEKHITSLKQSDQKVLDGAFVFRLYETFGFPPDLTRIMAEENGFLIDEAGYLEAERTAKEASRARKEANRDEVLKLDVHGIDKLKSAGVPETDDKYKWEGMNEVQGMILAIFTKGGFIENTQEVDRNEQLGIVLDKTNFYAEQGGQEYDTGHLTTDDLDFTVENVQVYGRYVLHTGYLRDGSLNVGSEVIASFDEERRLPIMRNHTGTHVLNWSLREVLGEGVQQKGSTVAEKKLKFDFSYQKPCSDEEIEKVENFSNDYINKNLEVFTEELAVGFGKKINGVRAIFGEAYPDPVRVVSIGMSLKNITEDVEKEDWRKYSIEFCGGTHVSNTKDIGSLIVVSEDAIAKGIRRMFAVTGPEAKEALRLSNEIDQEISFLEGKDPASRGSSSRELKIKVDSDLKGLIPAVARSKFSQRLSDLQKQESTLEKAKQKAEEKVIIDTLGAFIEPNGKSPLNGKGFVTVVEGVTSVDTPKLLVGGIQSGLKKFKAQGKATGFLFVSDGKKVVHVNFVAQEDQSVMSAKDWSEAVQAILGGKIGGRNDSFQGSEGDAKRLDEAVEIARKFMEKRLEKLN